MCRTKNRSRGFTLIELIIVIAIIGIIASILIPNLIDALQKVKQKRTMAEMRNLGTAWMSWLTDRVGAASAGALPVYDASNMGAVSYSQLDSYLRPSPNFSYTNSVTQFDGWNFPFSYCMNPVLSESNVLMICSPGRNGAYGENPDSNGACCPTQWTVGNFIGTDYDQDIVWADGYMVRYPGGFN